MNIQQKINIQQIRSNLTLVSLGNIQIYFSYETPIAFYGDNGLICSENIWSRTTGKHLNYIEPDKSKRVKHQEFAEKLEKILK